MPDHAPSDLVRYVYLQHIDRFGEPEACWRYGDGTVKEGEEHFPSRIDVMIWRAGEEVNITTFSTIGMADKPMVDCDFRAELHFAVRGALTEEQERKVASFLANLATYPFYYKNHLDWWHTMRNPGTIPYYSAGMGLLFHPRFVEDGWDSIDYNGQEVRLLNAIPITQSERQLIREKGVNALLDEWSATGMDIFTVR